jgi:hypothetical protein
MVEDYQYKKTFTNNSDSRDMRKMASNYLGHTKSSDADPVIFYRRLQGIFSLSILIAQGVLCNSMIFLKSANDTIILKT